MCVRSSTVSYSQSLSFTEAAITGGDKSEPTQSTCRQYTLSLLLQCFYNIHMIARVSSTGEGGGYRQLLSPAFTFVIWSTVSNGLRYVPSCTQHTCPIKQPRLLNSLDTWISGRWCGAQPVLKRVFAPLVLKWNWRRGGKKKVFKAKIFKCFQVLNAVVLRNIFDKIWKNEWMNKWITLKYNLALFYYDYYYYLGQYLV